MTPLAQKLIAQIRETGPMTVADYMTACLHDPEHGYYATRPMLGGDGADFITAPEASQMFGELIGLWCVHEWEQLGAPEPFNLIELGPGRGVLMQDALRAAHKHERFIAAARVTLVETSTPLRELQAERAPNAQWVETLEQTPPGPSIIIANEFLDCFPIRQFVRDQTGWREKLVGLDDNLNLTFGLSEDCGDPRLFAEFDRAGLQFLELAPLGGASAGLFLELERRFQAAPGRALFIDYGYAKPESADTLQALRNHQKEDPLANPGEADLTAHVNFADLSAAATATRLHAAGPITQGQFLHALGIEHRAAALAEANPGRADRISREFQRLTSPEAMGVLFKSICVSSPKLPSPAGF